MSRSIVEEGPRKVATSSGLKPFLEPLVPIVDQQPAAFLRLPRELRDQVYAYLLSTEYNKYEYQRPRRVGHTLNSKTLDELRLRVFRTLGDTIIHISSTCPSSTRAVKSMMKPMRFST